MTQVKLYRAAIIGAAAVAVVAGAVSLVAAASEDGRESFPDAFDAATRHSISGPILTRYRAEGGPDGPLGLPLSDEQPTTYEPATRVTHADREVGFRHGVIYLDSHTGRTEIGLWYAYTPPADSGE